MSRKNGKYLVCPICNDEFYIPKSLIKHRKHCSVKCKAQSQKGKPAWNLGKKMSAEARLNNSLAKRGEKHPNWGKHFSKERRENIGQGQRGKVVSEETKRKIGLANKGKTRTEEYKKRCSESMRGKNNHYYGKKFSDEHKKKLSDSHIGLNFGDKHPNWKGGISFEPYGIEFNKKLKAQIRARDGNQCQECKIYENGKTHAVHHIDYDKRNNNEDNLITLCASCHCKTGFNRKYWQLYFIDIQDQHFERRMS